MIQEELDTTAEASTDDEESEKHTISESTEQPVALTFSELVTLAVSSASTLYLQDVSIFNHSRSKMLSFLSFFLITFRTRIHVTYNLPICRHS